MIRPVKPSKQPGTPIIIGGVGSVGFIMGITVIAIVIGIFIARILEIK